MNDKNQMTYNRIEELTPLIVQWAEDRNIFSKGYPAGQHMKTLEEATELQMAIIKNDIPEIADAIGDVYVTLVIGDKMRDNCILSEVNSAMEDSEVHFQVFEKATASLMNDLYEGLMLSHDDDLVKTYAPSLGLLEKDLEIYRTPKITLLHTMSHFFSFIAEPDYTAPDSTIYDGGYISGAVRSLISLAYLAKLDLADCIEKAYTTISKRTGHVDEKTGVFIKDRD